MNSKRKTRPPGLGEWILRQSLRNDVSNHRLGDFEEAFQDVASIRGRMHAWRWYWCQIFRSVPEFVIQSIYWSGAMFKNYLKIAVRNIGKYRGYSFINITGLALGLACCILILLWIQDELSYDRFHENSNTIYRVVEDQLNQDSDIFPVAATPWSHPRVVRHRASCATGPRCCTRTHRSTGRWSACRTSH